MKKTTKAQETKVYTMMTIGYKGATPQPAFTFEAVSEVEANKKASGWARYQGYTMNEDVTVREAKDSELKWEKNNGYVSRY